MKKPLIIAQTKISPLDQNYPVNFSVHHINERGCSPQILQVDVPRDCVGDHFGFGFNEMPEDPRVNDHMILDIVVWHPYTSVSHLIICEITILLSDIIMQRKLDKNHHDDID